jgi:hypothetical protein
MDIILENAVKATMDVVNARLKATNNDDYSAALLLAEKAHYGILSEAYWTAEQGIENSYGANDYYNAALNVAEFLDYIVTLQENRLNDALMGIDMGGQKEEDIQLADDFVKVWGEFKKEIYKQLESMKQFVVLDQTLDAE